MLLPEFVRFRTGGLVVQLVLALMLGGTVLAQPSAEPSWTKQTLEWLETVDAGGRVRVVNPVGRIYARFGGYENQVEILATLQVPDGQPAPEVYVRGTDSGLEIATARAGDDAGRVDVVVFVPEGLSLDAEAENDNIEIKGVRGDVVASSGIGDIRIRAVQGRVRAKTVRGQISVELVAGATRESQSFVTETGDIEVYLQPDADAEVRIATSGEISTDFSLNIEHRSREEPSKHAVAIVGEGGIEMALTSKRGRVRLLRLPGDSEPEDPS